MPLPTLASIKRRRMLLGLTQKKLADFCGLSQSVIAKVEAGEVDPSYSTATRIFETLERLESKEISVDRFLELTAKELMTQRIISVKPTDSVSKAQKLLSDGSDISQLPVIDETGKAIGSLTEAQVLTQPDSDKSLVSDVMLAPFPIVHLKTRASTIRSILLEEPAVLVSDSKSGIAGIITKFDLIKNIRGVK